MHTITFIAGLLLILATLVDGFETILLPRRVNHRFRYSRLYYRSSWRLWRRTAAALFDGRWREAMLSAFGPLSLLGLFGSWVTSLILGFASLQWSVGSLSSGSEQAGNLKSFTSYLYFSGTTYFTLGLGDVLPATASSRALTVIEGGVGFGFLAVIISYLPILYQAFSRREVAISLMDARAGSPPTAGQFLLRLERGGRIEVDNATLLEWERWCAELLESQISFPVLAFYRSQHANQSWLAALTAMLDSCSLLLSLLPADESHQAQLTFAMARHAAVDITLIFGIRAPKSPEARTPRADPIRFRNLLTQLAGPANDADKIERRFSELRGLYEPFLDALAARFVLVLPPVIHPERADDNWQRSAWMPRTPGIGRLPSADSSNDHFG